MNPIVDPWRMPGMWREALRSEFGTLGDKLRMARLRSRLKRNSIYFFLASMGLGVVMTIMKLMDTQTMNIVYSNPMVVVGMWIGLFVGWILNFALLYYNWHLIRKGVLR